MSIGGKTSCFTVEGLASSRYGAGCFEVKQVVLPAEIMSDRE